MGKSEATSKKKNLMVRFPLTGNKVVFVDKLSELLSRLVQTSNGLQILNVLLSIFRIQLKETQMHTIQVSKAGIFFPI